MEHRDWWEAHSDSASQQIPRTLWNPKVQCCVHKSPPVDPILSQLNPGHTLTTCFFKIYLHMTLLPKPRSPSGPFLSSFPPKFCTHISSLPWVPMFLYIEVWIATSFTTVPPHSVLYGWTRDTKTWHQLRKSFLLYVAHQWHAVCITAGHPCQWEGQPPLTS
jgi:hypothetical protein